MTDQPDAGAPARARRAGVSSKLTILHVSDPQFGPDHLFGGNGLTPADQTHDTLFQRLHDDLAELATDPGLRPDLIVVTGDLTRRGMPSEFNQVVDFLTKLTDAVRLPRRRVAIVPGNYDVNRLACEAYFQGQAADEREPEAPYWPKWQHFAAAFERFYEGADGVRFTPVEPWTLFEIPELNVVVAGLNSTMAESHRPSDHYGRVGEHQLRWFADRLTEYRARGWLRLAAVHHNAVRGAVVDNENLRDAGDLDRWLGQPGLVNLLLHGHTHDGQLHSLSSGLLVLSTGSAAVSAKARKQEIPNQYQLLTVDPHGVTRYARQYAVGQRRWIGDTRISSNGSAWEDHKPYPLRDVTATFSRHDEERPGSNRVIGSQRDGPTPGHGFFNRVLEVTRASDPDATLKPVPENSYSLMSKLLPEGGVEQWLVGVVDGDVTDQHLASFVSWVRSQFLSTGPLVRSVLVYGGSPVTEVLVAKARRQGVRLRSFVDYQGFVDLRPLDARQAERLATDEYEPQQYRLLDDEPTTAAHDDLLGRVIEWLAADSARFVMVLGDSGRDKRFLLRKLACTLTQHLPDVQPVLLGLRDLASTVSLEELLAQHLIGQGMDNFEGKKLMHMIRSGRLALLFDEFDELEKRIGFDKAADYLSTLLCAATDNAKVVLTSRTHHFPSTAQIHTALRAQITTHAVLRVAVLEEVTSELDQTVALRPRSVIGDQR